MQAILIFTRVLMEVWSVIYFEVHSQRGHLKLISEKQWCSVQMQKSLQIKNSTSFRTLCAVLIHEGSAPGRVPSVGVLVSFSILVPGTRGREESHGYLRPQKIVKSNEQNLFQLALHNCVLCTAEIFQITINVHSLGPDFDPVNCQEWVQTRLFSGGQTWT